VSFAAGTRLGPYEIVAPLGAGGMGEVYRALDPRLGREVAVKVLPDAVAHDAERLARFEREARVLASLSHAGIASIFGIEEAAGAPALVMELVLGPTLDERIEAGPFPVDEVLPVARQLAAALEYAHDRGIIHRDLKPANVKVRHDGTVKVLDFGLARALDIEATESESDLTRSPTLTQGMTHAGMILGTAAYMSPEQARGRQADRRADIWAFGAVVYEMLAGKKAFAGETISDTLASVMRDEPDWAALPPGLAPAWPRLLRRCLAKDPQKRLQAIGEARIALDDLHANPAGGGEPAGGSAAPPLARSIRLAPWAIAVVSVAALVVTLSRREPQTTSATEFGIVPAGGDKIGLDLAYHPMAISPDGQALAYTVRLGGELRLRLRRLDTREDTEVPGAAGARNLFFSRDGQWVGFFNSRKLAKVSVRGGTPVELADTLQDRLGTWLNDGTIVYAPEVTEPLYRIPESGGRPTAITTLDAGKRERTHRFPCALDGGPWVVFTVQTVESPGGYDDASIDAVSVATGERRHLFKGARRAAWAPGGYLILARGSDLYATPIDPRDPRVTQDPVPVLAGVRGDDSGGSSYFSVADNGTLAWIPGREPDRDREVGWLDRSGRYTPIPIPVGPYLQLSLSPDGLRALILAGPGGGSSDLWLADLRTGGLNRLTNGGRSGSAVFMPDGVRIAHARRDPGGGETVVVRRLDGAGGERELYRSPNPVIVTGVTPDGSQVLFCDYGHRAGRIRLAPLDGKEPVALAAEGDGYEQAGRLSPDGRWLAYVSIKTRREEVCVRRLDGRGGSWQVSSKGAGGVRWGRDGRELYFVTGEMLYRAPIEVRGDELTVGQPEELFEMPPSPTETSFRDYVYDARSDRFLVTRPPRGFAEPREIALSLDWAARLKSRLGGSRPPAR
jgi:dipeptidyl aminopeptidase/acylaminoacyl peptidase